jgi:hypothetical protein
MRAAIVEKRILMVELVTAGYHDASNAANRPVVVDCPTSLRMCGEMARARLRRIEPVLPVYS